MASVDGFTRNILGVTDLVENPVNKVMYSGVSESEGPHGDSVDILDLPMPDKELLDLRDEWEKIYLPYGSLIASTFKRNLDSYLGRANDGRVLESSTPGAANLQFEAEETFLPAALARNPDPLVYSDNSPEGNSISDTVQTMLQFHADQLLLKRKLEVMVRQWSIYHLGVLKPGWDAQINDVAIENRKVQNFILDPNGYVDVYGNFSSWLGERISTTAEELIKLFPGKEQAIIETVKGPEGHLNLGTPVVYTEWWTDKYCFSTYKDIVLDKHKNEFFLYSEDEKDEKGEKVIGIDGETKKTNPRNHFAVPRKPYIFLSVFSLQERPHDITGLIEQNIRNQEKISKRTEQIDQMASQAVNGVLFSENNFNQETARQAADALSDPKKGKILVPAGGAIGESIVRLAAPNIPSGVFDDLENTENHLKSSWAIQGIASQEYKPEEPAKGMLINQGRDTSRIGGGISDVVEQSVARSVFNWLVQLYHVFYDEKHFASIMGIGKAVQYVELSSRDLSRQLIVSVAPNSMKPKDEITKMNEARDLYQAGVIGPKTLLKLLEFPDPDESAGDGVLWTIDKPTYFKMNFPELYARMQQMLALEQMAPQTAGAPAVAQTAPAPGSAVPAALPA